MRLACITPVQTVAPSDDFVLGRDYGPGTARPIAATTDQMASWFFRRAKLRIHGSLQAPLAGDNYRFDFTVHSRMFDDSRKEKAPLHSVYGFDAAASLDISSDDGLDTSRFDFALKIGSGTDGAQVVKVGTDRFVPIFFSVSVADVFESTENGGDTESLVALTIEGLAIPFFHDSDVHLLGGAIAIDAPVTDGFFEYRDSSGNNPLWNANTGNPNDTISRILAAV